MNKLVIITGGTKGIGRAITERFAAEGFDCLVTARTAKDLQELKTSIERKFAVTCETLVADAANKKDTAKFITTISAMNRPVDVLVNNAGVFRAGSLQEEPDGTLEHLIETNLYGAYYLTQGLLPAFQKQRSGHIFTVCSIASFSTPKNSGSYTISKFALLGFNRVLREELKPFGVRVTSVMPGATLTDSWAGMEFPDGRLMPPEDIAEAVWTAYNLKNSVVEELVVRPQLGDL